MTLPAPWKPAPAGGPGKGGLVLERDEVHLFLAETRLDPDQLETLSAFLTPAEHEQFQKFRMPEKRAEAILSRALLRERLSHFTGVPPQTIALTYNPHGKPELHDNAVRFNISHTAGYVLLGLSRHHELGVDIESPRTRIEHENLARRFFTPGEHAALMAAPVEERVAAFFRCWTRKEAILKASGRGISAGLDTFEVPLQPRLAPTPIAEWMLHDLPVPQTHVAALATRCRAAQLQFWSWQPPTRK
jgi:4'-phosphopantetheinyl transferase